MLQSIPEGEKEKYIHLILHLKLPYKEVNVGRCFP